LDPSILAHLRDLRALCVMLFFFEAKAKETKRCSPGTLRKCRFPILV